MKKKELIDKILFLAGIIGAMSWAFIYMSLGFFNMKEWLTGGIFMFFAICAIATGVITVFDDIHEYKRKRKKK